MTMSGSRPPQRRGLGRGLGSLIPTAPTTGAGSPGSALGPTADRDPRDDDRAGGPTAGHPDPHDVPSAGPGTAGADRHESSTDRQEHEGLTPVEGAYFAEIPVDQVRPNSAQPRQVFDEDAMAELVHSIREIGVLQPIVVRRRGDADFELVMGERRWRATRAAGLATVPAIVRETDDLDMLRDALLENLHRSDLNALEEAAAYQQLLEDFGCTHEELAARIGRSRPQISNTLRLLRLSPAVQRRVAAGVLSAGHARALLAVDDPGLQDRLAQRVVAEGISVRGLEEIVALRDEDSPAPRTPRKRAVTPDSATWPTGSRTASRHGSRSISDAARARSRWSSRPWTTSSASSRSWIRAIAPTARSDRRLGRR